MTKTSAEGGDKGTRRGDENWGTNDASHIKVGSGRYKKLIAVVCFGIFFIFFLYVRLTCRRLFANTTTALLQALEAKGRVRTPERVHATMRATDDIVYYVVELSLIHI